MTTNSNADGEARLFPSDLLYPSDDLVPRDSTDGGDPALLAVLQRIIATAEETKLLVESDVDVILDEIIRLAGECVDLAAG